MAGIIARVASLSYMPSSSRATGQCEYYDTNDNYSIINFDVAIGLTIALFSLSIAGAVADDCNTQFSTSWNATDVVLFGGPSILAT